MRSRSGYLAILAIPFLFFAYPIEAADDAAKKKKAEEARLKEAASRCGGKTGDALDDCIAKLPDASKMQEEAVDEAAKGLSKSCESAPDPKKCRQEAAKKAKALPEESPYSGISENFLLQFGVVTLAPFEVDRLDQGTPTKTDDLFMLETSDLSSRFMIEAGANLRWAWGRGDELARWDKNNPGWWLIGSNMPEKVWPRAFPDLQVRAGYTFGTDKKDASSAVGSGDLHAELFAGIPAMRYLSDDGFAVSIDFPEIGVSLVTNRNVQDIHNNWMIGPSLAASLPVGDKKKNRRVQLIWRIGYSIYEVPNLIGNTDLVENENGFPDFESEDGMANIVEFHYPLTDVAYASAIGRLYNGSDPNPWSFNVGVSIEIDSLAKGLLGLFGALGNEEDGGGSNDQDSAADS